MVTFVLKITYLSGGSYLQCYEVKTISPIDHPEWMGGGSCFGEPLRLSKRRVSGCPGSLPWGEGSQPKIRKEVSQGYET